MTMTTAFCASVCGATLLAMTSFANGQGTGTTSNSDQGVTSKQCWDISKDIVREKEPTTTGAHPSLKPTESTKTTNAIGSTSSGATSSGASGGSSTGNASARPVGMPDC